MRFAPRFPVIPDARQAQPLTGADGIGSRGAAHLGFPGALRRARETDPNAPRHSGAGAAIAATEPGIRTCSSLHQGQTIAADHRGIRVRASCALAPRMTTTFFSRTRLTIIYL